MLYLKKKALVTSAENHVCLAAVRSLGKNNLDVTAISCEKRALSFYSRYAGIGLLLHPLRNRKGS